MAFSGDLESFSLSDVFQKVQQNQDTGCLLIDDGKRPFHLFFKTGKVQGVIPASGEDPFISGVLSKRGKIEEKTLQKILKRAAKTGPIMAAHKAGVLTDSAARKLLEFYCAERIYDLFSIDKGQFTFEDGESTLAGIHPEQKKFGVDLDPGKLLFEAARRSDEWQRIKMKILSAKEVFTINEKKREAVGNMEPEAKEIFRAIDGQRTVADIVAISPESRFTVFKSLAALMEKGIIRPISAGDATTTARRLLQEGRFTEAIRVGRKGLEAERNNRELRRVVAEALAKKGEKAKAAGELKLLAFSFADGGNPSEAEGIYREVLDLDPRDFDARERLFELVSEKDGMTEALQEGQKFAEAAKKYGALDRAQDILGRLSTIAPRNPKVLTSLADIHERAGNREQATQLLVRAARTYYDEANFTEAKAVYERVHFLRPDDEESKRRIQEIKTGAAMKRARFRRILIRTILILLVLSLALAWIIYDWVAHMAFTGLTRKVVALTAESKYPEALRLCEAFQKTYPYTLAAYRVGELGEDLEALKGDGPDESEGSPPPEAKGPEAESGKAQKGEPETPAQEKKAEEVPPGEPEKKAPPADKKSD
ncbi:MAG: DUF4388 domain-containing protein [Planctomycetota bacterium]|jgi:tetratricopeptide (TPR) repeat protein